MTSTFCPSERGAVSFWVNGQKLAVPPPDNVLDGPSVARGVFARRPPRAPDKRAADRTEGTPDIAGGLGARQSAGGGTGRRSDSALGGDIHLADTDDHALLDL